MAPATFRNVIALALCLLPATGFAQQQPPANLTLFENVRIFDGKSATLSAPSNVLIRGNKIDRISQSPIATEAGTTVVPGGGGTLMPGLIDAHWHAMLVRMSPPMLLSSAAGYINLQAGAEATATLLCGFTTVRDLGGPVFDLKRANPSTCTARPPLSSVRRPRPAPVADT